MPAMSKGEMMANQRRLSLVACTVVVSGIVLGGVLVYGRFGVQRRGDSPMNNSGFVVDHVRLESDKPFEDVAKAFERQLGRFDPDVRKAATQIEDSEEAKARIEAMVGPSGFMLFGTQDHGARTAPRRSEAEGGPVRRR